MGPDRRRRARLRRARPTLRASTTRCWSRSCSMRASVQCELQFDDVRLPASTQCCRAPAACAVRSPRSTRRGTASCGVRSAPPATATRPRCGYALAREQFDRPIAGVPAHAAEAREHGRRTAEGRAARAAPRPAKDAGTLQPDADLARQAQQRARGDRDRPRSANDPRRERGAAGALPDPACGEPRVGAHLRGHRRGAHPRSWAST